MKTAPIVLSMLALAVLGGCHKDSAPQVAAPTQAAPQAAMPGGMAGMPGMQGQMPAAGPTASGTVAETMDAAEYTYVRVKTAQGDIWAAAGKFKVAVGEKVTVPLNMPMENFHSKTLNRTFPMIYFASHITREGEAMPGAN